MSFHPDSIFIDKKVKSDDSLDLAGLKKSGIDYIQNLCGNVWTDYNLHDPGITILEELCYALTDLLHRADFAVEDYLADTNNTIDFEKHLLYSPEEVLTTSPVTENDYRKFIYDTIADVENVWIEPVKTAYLSGLYDIFIALKSDFYNESRMLPEKKIQIIDEVFRLFVKNRNLCEDINAILIIEPCEIVIEAAVEIDTHQSPAAVLAKMYAALQHYFSFGIKQHQFYTVLKKNYSLADIYDGPKLEHGYIDDEDLNKCESLPEDFEAAAVLQSIPEVSNVTSIKVSIKTPPQNSDILPKSFIFKIPRTMSEYTIHIVKNNRKFTVPIDDFNFEFTKQVCCRNDCIDNSDNLKSFFPLPQGTYRAFDTFTSIQQDFPSIYGLGTFGSSGLLYSYTYSKLYNTLKSSGMEDAAIKEHVSHTVAAQVKQFKGYLYFFDQFLLNFCASCNNIKRLFSSDEELKQSYFVQNADNAFIEGIEEIYKEPLVSGTKQKIDAINNTYDNFYERRNRILDYLLSLYGEKLTHKSLINFIEPANGTTVQQTIIDSKIHLLKNIVRFSKSRFSGNNYSDTNHRNYIKENVSGVQFRTACVLGFDYMCGKRTNKNKKGEYFHVVEHILLRPRQDIRSAAPVIADSDARFYNNQISVMLPREKGRFGIVDFRNLVEETIYINCPAHIYPHFLWLSNTDFRKFEQQYMQWINIPKTKDTDYHLRNKLSEQIKQFIVKHITNKSKE